MPWRAVRSLCAGLCVPLALRRFFPHALRGEAELRAAIRESSHVTLAVEPGMFCEALAQAVYAETFGGDTELQLSQWQDSGRDQHHLDAGEWTMQMLQHAATQRAREREEALLGQKFVEQDGGGKAVLDAETGSSALTGSEMMSNGDLP